MLDRFFSQMRGQAGNGPLPSLPQMPAGAPSPVNLARDVVATVADVAGTPSEIGRSVRDAVKQTNSELATAINRGSLPPDPMVVVRRGVDAVVLPVQGTINSIQARMSQLGR